MRGMSGVRPDDRDAEGAASHGRPRPREAGAIGGAPSPRRAALTIAGAEAGSVEDRLTRIEARIAELAHLVEGLARRFDTSPGVRTVPLGGDVAMVRLVNGQRIFVDPRDIHVGQQLMMHGVWEQQFTGIIRRLIRRGQTCIDVGANYGYYSLLFARLAGAGGQIVAFEPNPFVFTLLQRSFAANGLNGAGMAAATAHQVALGAAPGEATLHFHPQSYGGGTVHPADALPEQDGLVSVAVRVATLDSYSIAPSRPIFLKIDTEGAEYAVLQGARATIAAAADLAMMIEFFPQFIARTLPVRDYLEFLRGLGLSFHLADAGRLVPAGDEAVLARGDCYLFLTKGPAPA
jgi:FkbM family methyltransferase